MSNHYISPSAKKIIDIAKGEVGYHEGRNASGWNNIQKYSPAVPGLEWSQGQAWCATFISWVALKSGFAALFPRTASTDTAAAWYKRQGRWSEYPAICAQGFLGTGNDMHHTFLVIDFDDTYVWTVEGNTNLNGSAQGDGTYSLKRLRRADNIVGYGYPKFPEGIVSADPAYAAQTPKPSAQKPAPTPAKKPAGQAEIQAVQAGLPGMRAKLRAARAAGRTGPRVTGALKAVNAAIKALGK